MAPNRLLHAPDLGPGARAGSHKASALLASGTAAVRLPGAGKRTVRRQSVPSEGTTQRDESGSRHKTPAQRVPRTKPKEAFEPFGGQAAAFTPRQRSAGKVLGSPRCPLPAWWYLEMFLDVLPVVGDAAGRDAGLSHQLKTDLPAQVVRNVPLLAQEREKQELGQEGLDQPSINKRGVGGGAGSEREAGKMEELVARTKSRFGVSSSGWGKRGARARTHLPLLIHLREELVHVRQVLVLKEKALRTRGRRCTGATGPQGASPEASHPMGAAAGRDEVAGPRWRLCLQSPRPAPG